MGVGSQAWDGHLTFGGLHARLVGVGSRTRRHLARSLVTVRNRMWGLVPSRRPLQGLAVVGLVFYGAWLIYHPAAYLSAAALLLLDLVTDRS